VCAGAIAVPASTRRAPRGLLAIARRGLAVDPALRWPDMPTLLDALERRTRAGRRRAIAAVAAVALGSAAIAASIAAARGTQDPCMPPVVRLAAVWGDAQHDALRAHVLGVDPAQGAGRHAMIARALDAGAQAWSAMYVATCRATRVEHRQPDSVLDLRMQCLDRWLVELGDTIAVVGQAAGPGAVDLSARAATSLSPLDACADAAALTAAPPPAGPAARATAVALANRTRALDVAQRAGRHEGLAASVSDLVAAARRLGHIPTLVGALAVQANVLHAIGDHAAAEPVSREIVQLAASVHDDRAEAVAWMQLIGTTAQSKGRVDDALALVPSARAAVARAGEPIDLRAELLLTHALVLDGGARAAEALALLDEARRLLEHAGARAPSSPLARKLNEVLDGIVWSYMCAGNLAAAIATAHESIDRWRAVSGADSVDEALPWRSLADALLRAHRHDEALDATREAVRIREARSGESPALALTLTGEADVLAGSPAFGRGPVPRSRADRAVGSPSAPWDRSTCEPRRIHRYRACSCTAQAATPRSPGRPGRRSTCPGARPRGDARAARCSHDHNHGR
ncbi:MAG TPA: tetratricopeptide repeat protein, partial [Kofleriaceae bacterium]|nr:tetratricopeptide repeat protein [Kofleriaceae bacterium]